MADISGFFMKFKFSPKLVIYREGDAIKSANIGVQYSQAKKNHGLK